MEVGLQTPDFLGSSSIARVFGSLALENMIKSTVTFEEASRKESGKIDESSLTTIDVLWQSIASLAIEE